MNHGDTHNYIRRLMALLFVPSEHIPPVFDRLSRKAGTQALQDLTEYVKTTWIESEQWSPASWTVMLKAGIDE